VAGSPTCTIGWLAAGGSRGLDRVDLGFGSAVSSLHAAAPSRTTHYDDDHAGGLADVMR
jgi:hypothetical protein